MSIQTCTFARTDTHKPIGTYPASRELKCVFMRVWGNHGVERNIVCGLAGLLSLAEVLKFYDDCQYYPKPFCLRISSCSYLLVLIRVNPVSCACVDPYCKSTINYVVAPDRNVAVSLLTGSLSLHPHSICQAFVPYSPSTPVFTL